MKWDLKAVLARHKKTVTGAAKAVGVSRSHMSKWVNSDKFPGVSQEELEEIARYIGCPITEFLILEESDFKSPSESPRSHGTGRRVA